jgi:hypothetical protein
VSASAYGPHDGPSGAFQAVWVRPDRPLRQARECASGLRQGSNVRPIVDPSDSLAVVAKAPVGEAAEGAASEVAQPPRDRRHRERVGRGSAAPTPVELPVARRPDGAMTNSGPLASQKYSSSLRPASRWVSRSQTKSKVVVIESVTSAMG